MPEKWYKKAIYSLNSDTRKGKFVSRVSNIRRGKGGELAHEVGRRNNTDKIHNIKQKIQVN